MTRCMGGVAVLIVGLLLPGIAASADPAKSKGGPAKPATGQRVGVLDINRLFKNHADLKGKLQELQVEAKLVQAKLESDLAAVNKKAEGLKDLPRERPNTGPWMLKLPSAGPLFRRKLPRRERNSWNGKPDCTTTLIRKS